MLKKRYLIPVLSLLMIALMFTGCKKKEKENVIDPADYLSGYHYVELDIKDYGKITLELNADAAPVTVTNFISLVDSGFYNGLTFHRIMSGFMMQGGDPNGNGTGGAENSIIGEFFENGIENPISHVRGTISMARAKDYDSASSQFFIVHMDATGLDGSYAAFGKVIAGMNVVDIICVSVPAEDDNGTVAKEIQPVISSARVITKEEADAAVEAENVKPDPSATVSFHLINSTDGLITAANWDIDESGELLLAFSDTDLLSLSLYRIDLSESIEETEENRLASYSNLRSNELITLRLLIPEGLPNTMLVAEEHNGAVARYLICYDGNDGSAYLVPLIY